jgi:hypothetical protein
MMHSIEEHQEIPKEDAAVMPVREPKKQHTVCKVVTGRRQKRTRRNRGSRRKSVAACKRVSHCAKVAWRKINRFRRTGTQENCVFRKRVTLIDRKLTRYTGVVWLKEKVRTHYEGRKGLEDLDADCRYVRERKRHPAGPTGRPSTA